MKKILIGLLIAAAVSSCDIDRLPYTSMDEENIASNPDAMVTGTYAQLKAGLIRCTVLVNTPVII